MSFEKQGNGTLNYMPCRYGPSRLVFRGPKRKLSGDYTLFLGGTETYGKFLKRPFPDLIERETGKICINFGCVNAGVDVFLSDPVVQLAAQGAETVVIQLLGAQNMSNRYYRVHPRRNDRFIGASQVMKMVFREIDFTEFHFTRHMLGTLSARAPDRFKMLRDELQLAWLARMKLLLNSIPGRKVLLWLSAAAPANGPVTAGLGQDPMFVDRRMIEVLRPFANDYVEVVASKAAMAQGTDGMIFNEMEKGAAKRLLGKSAHEEAAAALLHCLSQ